MESLTWGFIGTIIGAIVGAGSSIATTIINSNNQIITCICYMKKANFDG